MPRLTTSMLCVSVLLLSSCGQQSNPETANPTNSRVPDDNVFKDQVRALEKAEDVQNTLDAAEAQRRQMVEGQ